MSMNPRITTEKIRDDYQEYIASILSVNDKEITKLAYKAIKDTEFVKGPFLETTLPFVDGHTLKYLAEEEKLISSEFANMGESVHYDEWKLRIHQEAALRKIITEQRNMIVSTGTGSGKTECYLYPIFNELMREKEAGTLDPGVRALLIFPMNALANDQQKKLRKLLKDYPDITFGRYTGETQRKRTTETADKAEKRLHEEYDMEHATDNDSSLRKAIPNELMCREKMVETPPHILLTNYAMLEYMLLQPDTAPFFDNQSAKNWRFIVIDEAHTYKGANGTEIAYLLRRVKERIRHNMDKPFRCIATSATLGSEEAKAGLAVFAEHLFDEPFEACDVITTKRQTRTVPTGAVAITPAQYKELKKQTEGMEELDRGKLLYDALSKDLHLYNLYKVLGNRPKRIEDVSSEVFDDLEISSDRENALIDLIELAAAARRSENEAALLPARYHLFVKSLEGMFVQYYPKINVYLDRKERVLENNNSYSVFELANCQKCGQEYLLGKSIEYANGNYFVQTSSYDKPDYYFISNKEESELENFDEDDYIEEKDKMKKLEKYHLCLSCGRITPIAEHHPVDCCANSDTHKIVTAFKLTYGGKDSESNCCPCCGATRKGLIKRFLTANQPATFAVAKSLYDAIPPRPIKVSDTSEKMEDFPWGDDIFDNDSPEDSFGNQASAELMDESGRKLLIFSDNRQEAAFFAGFFEKRYALYMWRKVILKVLEKEKGESFCVDDLIEKVFNEADKSGLYSIDLEQNTEKTDMQKKKIAAQYIMQELLRPDIQLGLEGHGYIDIYPEDIKFKKGIEIAGVSGSELWYLIRVMMDTLREKGAITYPENIRATDDFFAPRNHYRYFREQGTSSNNGVYVYGFIPEDKSSNRRLGFITKLFKYFGLDVEAARHELKKLYALILKLGEKGYIVKVSDKFNGIVYALNYAKWNFRYNDDKKILYRCNKCGKVFNYSIKNLCPEGRCDGCLEEIEAREIRQAPYYSKIYADNKLIPMVAREHTAQLASITAGEYQKNFEEGKINVLSCSTTFEMGVDVGELEATFQRNVPPETSNYIQRAGRAGRRTSSAAFSVTFSRRSSHDMTFFQNPTKIIAGKINAPILEVDNEKMAERHLNSIVVAWFFKKSPDYFKKASKELMGYGEGDNMVDALRKALLEKPKELLDSIHAVLSPDVCKSLKVDDWAFIDNITGIEGSLTQAINERRTDVDGLKRITSGISDEPSAAEKRSRNMAEKLIETLNNEPSISFLSANGVLPKYGFPIDTVSLDIISGSAEEARKIDLSRDLKMAITEFAPPSQIVANGKVWKSYAINIVPDKGWPTYIYRECPKCKKIYAPDTSMVTINANPDSYPSSTCKCCGTMLNNKKFIIPIFGFSTQMGEKPARVGDSRPNTYYATQTQFWGIEDLTDKQKAEVKKRDVVCKGKIINVTYSPGGKLFVLNQGRSGRGIRVCPSCGYANYPGNGNKNGTHKTKYGKPCAEKHLETVSLGHKFSTDILKISLPSHAIKLENEDGVSSKDQYLSTLYAILEGASTALDISRDDISGCVDENGNMILFDDTEGGSGLVKHIYDHFEKVLREAKHKVSGLCGCAEETSCYGCLRNYSNQYFHDELSRGLAYRYLDWLLNGTPEENQEEIKDEPQVISNDSYIEEVGMLSSNYIAPNTTSYENTLTCLEALYNDAEDEVVKIAYKKLMECVRDRKLENPIIDDKIPVAQKDIWPEVFWGKSHVALFTQSAKNQYDELKKYDWYCYILDENIDAERVIGHIERR